MTRETAITEGLLPWQCTAWGRLQQARRGGRLPHALLLAGPVGVGKRRLVAILVRSLLCPQPDPEGFACGRCRDCELLEAGTHPDWVSVGPDEEGKSHEIKVAAIRALAGADALTAHRGGRKVIVIDPAHQMNTAAANALLKTLEEPAPDTLLCLVCERPERLPATVRSRCQQLQMGVPPEPEALAWLQEQTGAGGGELLTLLRLAHGGPLAAVALRQSERMAEREKMFSGFVDLARGARDPITEASAWSQLPTAIVLDWLSGWISDILRLAGGHAEARLINADKAEVLAGLARRIRPETGHRYFQRILAAKGMEDSTLNALLIHESLLAEWARLARR